MIFVVERYFVIIGFVELEKLGIDGIVGLYAGYQIWVVFVGFVFWRFVDVIFC
jgi:hypothetical protein